MYMGEVGVLFLEGLRVYGFFLGGERRDVGCGRCVGGTTTYRGKNTDA